MGVANGTSPITTSCEACPILLEVAKITDDVEKFGLLVKPEVREKFLELVNLVFAQGVCTDQFPRRDEISDNGHVGLLCQNTSSEVVDILADAFTGGELCLTASWMPLVELPEPTLGKLRDMSPQVFNDGVSFEELVDRSRTVTT